MSIRILYARYCDGEDCKKWTGAVRKYPDPDEEAELRFIQRMGWSHDGNQDFCPNHKPGSAA